MNISKLAGACLIILAVANMVYAVITSLTGPNHPGYLFVLVTALLFSIGVFFLRRKRVES